MGKFVLISTRSWIIEEEYLKILKDLDIYYEIIDNLTIVTLRCFNDLISFVDVAGVEIIITRGHNFELPALEIYNKHREQVVNL